MSYTHPFQSFRDLPEGSVIPWPGKFESEPRYAPELWDISLGGDAIELGDGIVRLDICKQDREVYPELCAFDHVYMFEDEQGFVYVATELDPDRAIDSLED